MATDVDAFRPVHRHRVRNLAAAAGLLIAVAVAVVAVAQRVGAWESRSITEVWITSEREVIVLGHCDQSARVQVDATASTVVFDLQTRGAHRGDCLEGVIVQLDQDLGERALIDASTEEPVSTICAEDGSACVSAPSS